MLDPKYDLDSTERLILENTEKIVMLPWNGVYVPFKIRMLNATQMKSCGDFSVLSIVNEDDEKDVPDLDNEESFMDILKLKNTQEKMLELALVHPTFNEMAELLGQSDLIKSVKSTLALCEKKVADDILMSLAQKIELTKEIDNYNLYLSYLYPDDFIGAFVQYVTQRGHTDLDVLTHKILLEAGLSSDRFKGRPSDYIEGNFTEFQKHDMDNYAVMAVYKFKEDIKTSNNAKDKWHRNKKKYKGTP